MTPLTESYCPAPAGPPVRETTVGGVLREQAAKTPDAVALVEAGMNAELGRSWTYAELLADAERLAHALLTRYAPGERICVWAPNIPEWVIAEFAMGLAGLTLVTANPAYRPRELKFVLEQSRSVGLFIVKEYRGNPMAEIAAEVAAGVKGLREVIDMEDRAALFDYAGPRLRLPDVSPTDPAQVQYTSGTTGFPKGAVLHHLGLTNNARFTMGCAGVGPGDTLLNFMPMFHTSGCACATLGAVQHGARMIICKLFEPNRMLDLMEAEGGQLLFGVPTMLTAMTEAQGAQPRDLKVRMALSGGSMVPPELIRKINTLFGCPFQVVYGQTESSPVVTQVTGEDSFDDACNTVGRPSAHTEISIRDPGTNVVVPIGAVGEICARGYCVMLGYNDNPEATAAAIDADGWLHTGDLGTLDERGYVRVTGRVKEMIIRGGENLFPAEIENVLLEHRDVAEVAVVGVPDERWGETVACFVRLAAGATLDRNALIAHCRAHLAPQKTPAQWIEVTEWPLTGSGKIQKFVLRDQLAAGELQPA
ncbi:MAG TPA: AMP-binding protein [Caulobacteraceae bacterium]|nr:AMP-binding protein [Caulobacteraceae bacterium]